METDELKKGKNRADTLCWDCKHACGGYPWSLSGTYHGITRKPAAYLRTILQGYERDDVLTAADLEATQGKEPLRQQPDDGYLHPGSVAYDEEWARRVREHQKERRARRLAAEQGMNQEEDDA